MALTGDFLCPIMESLSTNPNGNKAMEDGGLDGHTKTE